MSARQLTDRDLEFINAGALVVRPSPDGPALRSLKPDFQKIAEGRFRLPVAEHIERGMWLELVANDGRVLGGWSS